MINIFDILIVKSSVEWVFMYSIVVSHIYTVYIYAHISMFNLISALLLPAYTRVQYLLALLLGVYQCLMIFQHYCYLNTSVLSDNFLSFLVYITVQWSFSIVTCKISVQWSFSIVVSCKYQCIMIFQHCCYLFISVFNDLSALLLLVHISV